ncbi:hypothetical protein C8Q80DRAFT_160296 [Daedaleopsis nitida]|nr:hypothetical protein C8Q80DRAFT_160296 [Daedaleopsis nitida]
MMAQLCRARVADRRSALARSGTGSRNRTSARLHRTVSLLSVLATTADGARTIVSQVFCLYAAAVMRYVPFSTRDPLARSPVAIELGGTSSSLPPHPKMAAHRFSTPPSSHPSSLFVHLRYAHWVTRLMDSQNARDGRVVLVLLCVSV